MKLSTGPPHQMSNWGLSFSLRKRVRDSPLDMRTKFTVMSGLAFSNSAFIPSHHWTWGVHSTLSSVLAAPSPPELAAGGAAGGGATQAESNNAKAAIATKPISQRV